MGAVHDGMVLKRSIQRSPVGGLWLSSQIRSMFEHAEPKVALTPTYLIENKTPVDALTPTYLIENKTPVESGHVPPDVDFAQGVRGEWPWHRREEVQVVGRRNRGRKRRAENRKWSRRTGVGEGCGFIEMRKKGFSRWSL